MQLSVDEYGFERATPVMRSADYQRSRRFYADLLGFSIVEEGGDPPRFGIFQRGGAVLFVNAWDGPRPPEKEGWDAYFHVAQLDALHAALRDKLGDVPDIVETVYGMREFVLRDPDGNWLCFGFDGDPKG